jgi:predicted transposase YdaD
MGSVIEELLEEGREEGREEGIGIGRKEGEKKGREEGREEERVRTVGLLLAMHSPETLLHAPQFQPFGYMQADIDAALALNLPGTASQNVLS